MKLKLIILLLSITPAAVAQVGESAFHVSWVTMKPTYTDYVGKTSSRGFNVGFTKFINERFGAGLSGSYSVLDDYVPRQTYEFPGGAITTDIFNYMYFYTLTANGQYYFKTEGLFVPYASLSAGAAFTEYTIFYNAYSDSDTKTSFNLRPELGALYRFQKYSTLGMKAAISYDYVTNKSEYFDLKNFSALSFQIGFVLFND